MRTLLMAAALAVVVQPGFAQGVKPGSEMQVYGPGTASCATYLNDRSLRFNADGWILGFWTGSNRVSDNHGVGSSTDSRGIVGEVALACRNHPSVSLFQTEKEVYDRMKGEGR